MDITSWPEILGYVLTLLFGGGLVKWGDAWLNRTKARNENAKNLRDETRTELNGLKEEIRYYKEELRRVQSESDKYKMEAWSNMIKLKEFQLQVSQLLIDHGINPKDVLRNESQT